MKVDIDDIEVSDVNVVSTTIGLEKHFIIIMFAESYYVPEKRWLGDTKLTITSWTDFVCIKNIHEDGASNTSVISTKKYDEIETFKLVQQIILNENVLILNGWSKETPCWLSYEFINASIVIETK